MAINPMFTSGYYFLSSMYDDTLLTTFYNRISEGIYSRAKLVQDNIVGRDRVKSNAPVVDKLSLDDFIINKEFNTKLNLPVDTYSIKLTNIVLHIHNKRAYLRKYGTSLQRIPIIDMITEKNIFELNLSIFIADYRMIKGYILVDIDSSIYYILYSSSTDGVLKSQMDTLKLNHPDGDLIITTNEHSSTYSYSGPITTVIPTITSISLDGDNYTITIPKSTALNTVDLPLGKNNYNSWDCMITHGVEYGQNILTSITATSISTSEDSLNFSVPKNAIDDIRTRLSTINMIFIHRYNTSSKYTYLYSDDSRPIINLPYSENPSTNINIEVFEYNEFNQKGKILYDMDLTQSYFPNIFDFSNLNINNKNLCIEISEYMSEYTNQKLHNSLSALINILGEDVYTSMIVNGHLDVGDTPISEFNPTDYPLIIEEYSSSEYYGNVRGFILDKIVNMITSDPALYALYHAYVQLCNRRMMYISGHPNTIGFGGLEDLGPLFTGRRPIVNDTSAVSVFSEDIISFDEPHSYILYRSVGNERAADIFFAGLLIEPTVTRYYNNYNYAYFPVDKIKSILTPMANRIQDNILTDPSPSIIIDLYIDGYKSAYDTPTDSTSISAIGDSFSIFGNEKDTMFALSDILFYDMTTRELVDIFENFDISLSVSQIKLDDYSATEQYISSSEDVPNYLITILNKFYNTADSRRIILKGDRVTISITDYINEMVSAGIYSSAVEGYLDISLKKIDFADVTFTVKSNAVIGKTLSINTNNFRKISYLQPEDINGNILIFENIIGCADSNRYQLYVNDKLFPRYKESLENYTISLDSIFGGSVTITLPIDHSINLTDDVLRLVYSPISYTGIETGLLIEGDRSGDFSLTPMLDQVDYVDINGTNIHDIFKSIKISQMIEDDKISIGIANGEIGISTDTTLRVIVDGVRVPLPNHQLQGVLNTINYSNDEILSLFTSAELNSLGTSDIINMRALSGTPIFNIDENPTIVDTIIDTLASTAF